MRAGRLKRRVTLQAPSTTKDAFGQPLQQWTDALDTWAEIATITAREVYALGSGFTAQVSHRVTLRFPDVALAAGMRVSYEARLFLVQAVSDPSEDRRELDLLCLELSK